MNALVNVDVAALERELRKNIRGEVRFGDGDRALYSTDASNYRQIPIGVVLPRDVDDVVTAVAICREFAAPIVSRGGGTDLAGSTCNAAVVLDMSKYMNRVLAIDWDAKVAHVQPGTVLDDLRHAAEQHHLTFGPDPATHNRNTLGGMIGNNSCGMHAQMAGEEEEETYVLEIDWDNKWARVETGCVLDDLRHQAEQRHLTFGPDPATHNRNTLGGMIGNNSCGMHAQMAGKVEENTIALEILTYDGSRMWVGATSDDELETIKGEGGVGGAIYSRLG